MFRFLKEATNFFFLKSSGSIFFAFFPAPRSISRHYISNLTKNIFPNVIAVHKRNENVQDVLGKLDDFALQKGRKERREGAKMILEGGINSEAQRACIRSHDFG